jgi:hypothetical protein
LHTKHTHKRTPAQAGSDTRMHTIRRTHTFARTHAHTQTHTHIHTQVPHVHTHTPAEPAARCQHPHQALLACPAQPHSVSTHIQAFVHAAKEPQVYVHVFLCACMYVCTCVYVCMSVCMCLLGAACMKGKGADTCSERHFDRRLASTAHTHTIQ